MTLSEAFQAIQVITLSDWVEVCELLSKVVFRRLSQAAT